MKNPFVRRSMILLMSNNGVLLLLLLVLNLNDSNSSNATTTITNDQQQQQQQRQECTVTDDGNSVCVDATTQQNDDDEEQPFCGLYMAESTIPGAGVGIFTAVEKNIGDTVGDGDICIPVIDMYWHNSNSNDNGFFNPFYDYFWNGFTMGMKYETDSGDIEALCPGLDCAINCNLALLNVEKSTPVYDDASLHRSIDAGIGTFSPYGNGTTKVSRYIPPGGELFKYYGDHWFEVRTHIFGLLPLSNDYPRASKLLSKMIAIFTNVSSTNVIPDTILEEYYEELIIKTINTKNWESRTLNAFPKSYKDAVTAGTAADVSVIHQPNAIRDTKWLQQNGKCIDHIVSRRSTIYQAGHGAFAKRNLKAGTVITASPLHHLPDYTFMNMYNFTNQINSKTGAIEKTKWYKLQDEIRQMQLLYNYCYGHEEMTMILCPYGAGVNYINHNKTLANVKIQWATDLDLVHNQQAVSNWTIDDFRKTNKPILAFDYVLTRDVVAGEELFLDYGDLWEEEWNGHVEKYQNVTENNVQHSKRYASAHRFNQLFNTLPLRTVEEQVHDPYPNNLHMRCRRSLLQNQPSSWLSQKPFVWQPYEYGVPCRVIDRFTETINGNEHILYTVQIEWTGDDTGSEDDEDDSTDLEDSIPTTARTVTWIERTDVHRSAIRFFDIPYTTDIHLPSAFRHEIQIPDHMIPPQWRNLE